MPDPYELSAATASFPLMARTPERALNEIFVHLTRAAAELGMAAVWLEELWRRDPDGRYDYAARWLEHQFAEIRPTLAAAVEQALRPHSPNEQAGVPLADCR